MVVDIDVEIWGWPRDYCVYEYDHWLFFMKHLLNARLSI